MSDPAGIIISRDGLQYGPYTLAQLNTYLGSGSLLATDMAWNAPTSAWIPLASLPGIVIAAQPPPPPIARPRNVAVLVAMAVVWWMVSLCVIFVFSCFVAGMVAGATHPANPQEAGRHAGELVGRYAGFPILLTTLAASIWLTVIGKLPGTRK